MQHGSRLFAPLFRLQWKLTLSYTITTMLVLVSILVVSFTIALVGLGSAGNKTAPQLIESIVQNKASQAARFFKDGDTPDRAALNGLLSTTNSQAPTSLITYHGFLAALDKNRKVITSLGDRALSANSSPELYLSASDITLLHMLDDGLYPLGVVHQDANGTLTAFAPITDQNRNVGIILMQASHVQLQALSLLPLFSSSALPGTLLALLIYTGVAATIFGFITTRGFAQRMKRLFIATNSWSQGNFSVFVQDSARDEVGQLTRQLNRMAEQLQSLLHTRQKLASLEERNRLARDLHDSVKQHLFVIALQIGTAKGWLGQNREKVEYHLTEAEHVLHQVEQELVVLIRELRPATLEEKGLVVVLRELILQWKRQTGITAKLQLEGEEAMPSLPPTSEEALFRVTQEALSNVVRHSKATAVDVHLTHKAGHITLSISDDGQGFDRTKMSNKGIGLLSMQERMANVHGNIQIESAIGQGTRIIVDYELRRTAYGTIDHRNCR